jgi:erythronate-4-phosphate dehydrogenase
LTFEGIDKTYHLADENFFNSLKEGCIFINTARGAVVDINALKKAMKIGKIKAAVLDVWENEPDIDTELLEMADIGTPHIAGYSLDGKAAGIIMIYQAVCKYFGLPAEKKIEDFLPEAAPAKIEIEVSGVNEQEILRQTVKKIYDITKDDADLRRILNMSKNKSGFIFDRLQKAYHIRREFHNTNVILATEDTEKRIEKKLEGIGFKISEGKKRK